MAETTIAWTDYTANPWEGCMKVSPLCDHCYAECDNIRFRGAQHWGAKGPRRDVKNWRENIKKAKNEAIRQGRKMRVFVASMADIFEKPMPMESNGAIFENYTTGDRRKEFFALAEATPECTFLLLTKRPQNINGYVPSHWHRDCPSNIWFGCSVGLQEEADRSIPYLLSAPGTGNKFLSIEPMLGLIDLGDSIYMQCPSCEGSMTGHIDEGGGYPCNKCLKYPQGKVLGISWIIVGGESGHGARPMMYHWAESIKDQCDLAGVPFFFKQWGNHVPARYEGHDGHVTTMVKSRTARLATWLDGQIHQSYPESMTAPLPK